MYNDLWNEERLEAIATLMNEYKSDMSLPEMTENEIRFLKMYYEEQKKVHGVSEEECPIQEFVVMVLNKNVKAGLEAIVEKRTAKWPPGVPEGASEELKEMIRKMYSELKPDIHVDVYPNPPPPGVPIYPTGGLARCECSATCTRRLNVPAYKLWEDRVPEELRQEREQPARSEVRCTARQKRLVNKLMRPYF